jgi:hypothetical protein
MFADLDAPIRNDAADRDIEVQPTNLQIPVLLNHMKPVMARPQPIPQGDGAPIARE